jgi:DNA-binding FadR family transcriptional regulator
VEKEKASDRVFKYIEERIANGIWKPGDKITPELQLVEELGVSRISVREAIQKLATLDILVKKRGGGTFVNKFGTSSYMAEILPLLILGESNYKEIMEFRSAIDVIGVKLFVKNADDETVNELENIYEKMEENKDNPKDFFEYDMMFHRVIAKGTENSIFNKITEMTLNITKYYAVEQYHELTSEQRIIEHKLILEAIKSRDAEIASIYMDRHIKRTIRDLEKTK